MRCIILNRVDEISLYKRALHKVLKTRGNTLILGYGYISDGIFSEETFIKAIEEGFNDTNEINEIILLGCKDIDCRKYIRAAKKLEEKFKGVVIKLLIKDWEDSKFKDKKTKENLRRAYHKKVAIKLDRKKDENDDYTIKIGLLGSSNLTNPAYRDNIEKHYGKVWKYETNSELDILIWNPNEIDEDFKININKESEKLEILSYLDRSKYKIDLPITLQLYEIVNEVYNYRDNNFNMIILDENFPQSYIKQYFELNCYKEEALKKCMFYYYLQEKEEEEYSRNKHIEKYTVYSDESTTPIKVEYNIFKYNKEKVMESNKILSNKSEFIRLINGKYVLNNDEIFKNYHEFVKELIQLLNKHKGCNEYKDNYMITSKEKEIVGQQNLFDYLYS